MRHHLTAVTDAERKGIGAFEKGREFGPRALVVHGGAGPAAPRPQDIAVGEAAASGETAERSEVSAAGNNIAHVQIDGMKAGALKRRGHLDVSIHALLS
ncbi:MAG: hypothetical protein USCGTAYLOR_01368 [Chromatiales bacterium USCg_Taylor]|nr:MAG: hypothetical protein USCGTAYLOR_01368 [Chromatiales bacterium USCg_Taylor]